MSLCFRFRIQFSFDGNLKLEGKQNITLFISWLGLSCPNSFQLACKTVVDNFVMHVLHSIKWASIPQQIDWHVYTTLLFPRCVRPDGHDLCDDGGGVIRCKHLLGVG